jgi:hypothetical protein
MKQEDIKPEAIYIHPKLKRYPGPRTGSWWLKDFASRDKMLLPTWWSGGWDELEEVKTEKIGAA